MNRFKAAWQEFVKSIQWISDAPKGLQTVWNLLGTFLILAGPALLGLQQVPSLQEALAFARPFAVPLCVASGVYVVWLFAVAWERTRGPIIWMGPVEIDSGARFFEFWIKNKGTGSCEVHAYAIDLRDHQGARIPMIDSQIELHFRGVPKGAKVNLQGEQHVIAAVLQMQTDGAGMNFLALVLPSPPAPPVQPVTWPIPVGIFRDLKPCYLTVRIDFLDADGKCLKSKLRRFQITPDASVPLKFRVEG